MRFPVNNLLVTCALLLSIVTTPVAMGQQGVQEVSTESLKRSPHRYWAKRVIFRDTLTRAPSSSSSKIKGNRYFSAYIEDLGDIYLTEEAREELNTEDSLDREFIFRGTVLNKGNFIGKNRFFFIVESVVQKIDPSADIEDLVDKVVTAPAGEAKSKALRTMGELLYTIQSACLVYSTEQDIDFNEIFDTNSLHHENLMDIIRAVLRPLERQGSMPPSEIISHLLASSLVKHYGSDNTPDLMDPAEGFTPVSRTNETPSLETFLPATDESSMEASLDDLSEKSTDQEMLNEDLPSLLANIEDAPEKIIPADTSESNVTNLHENTRELLKVLDDNPLEEPAPLELDLDFDF